MKESQKVQLKIYGLKSRHVVRFVFVLLCLSSLAVFEWDKCQVNRNDAHVPQVQVIEMNLEVLFITVLYAIDVMRR